MPTTTTTTVECDVAAHAGDRNVPQPNAPKDQPFGWALPNGENIVICAADVLKRGDDASAILTEMGLKLREAYAETIATELDKLEAGIIGHRAELRKRRAVKS